MSASGSTSAEFDHQREGVICFSGENGPDHFQWRIKMPPTFEEVLNEDSVYLVRLPDGCIKVVAEDAVDVLFVVCSPKEQEESVAVFADRGAEVHHPLTRVLVPGLHPGHLDGFAADLCCNRAGLSSLPLR